MNRVIDGRKNFDDEEAILGSKSNSRRATLPMMEPSPLYTPLSITINRNVHLAHISFDGSSPRRPTPGSRRPSLEPTQRPKHLSVPSRSRRPSSQPAHRPHYTSLDGSQSSGSSGSRRPSFEPAPSTFRPGHLSVDVGSRRPSQTSALTPVTPTKESSAPSPLKEVLEEANGETGILREKIRKNETGRLSKATRLPAWYY